MAKSSFVERNKAVREAWNKEQELVQGGKGTREWMPEQQKDILWIYVNTLDKKVERLCPFFSSSSSFC